MTRPMTMDEEISLLKKRSVFTPDMTSEERRRKAAADRVAKARERRYNAVFEAKRLSHDQEASLAESASIEDEMQKRRRGHRAVSSWEDLTARLISSAIKRDPNTFFVYMAPSPANPIGNEPLPGLIQSLHLQEAMLSPEIRAQRRARYDAFESGALAEGRELRYMFQERASEYGHSDVSFFDPRKWNDMLDEAVKAHEQRERTPEVLQMHSLVSQGALPRDAPFVITLFTQYLTSLMGFRREVELTATNHRLYAAFTQLANMSHMLHESVFFKFIEDSIPGTLQSSFIDFATIGKDINIGLMRMMPVWYDELRDIEEMHRVPDNERIASNPVSMHSLRNKLPQLKRYLIHRIYQLYAASAPVALAETSKADDAELAALLGSMNLAAQSRRPRTTRQPAVKSRGKRKSKPKAAQGRTRQKTKKAAARGVKKRVRRY